MQEHLKLEKHSFIIKVLRIFTVPILNYLPSSIIQFFMKRSSRDASTVVASGGTTHALEVMYGRYHRKLFSRGISQGMSDILWHHIVSQPKALRNRLKIVQYLLEKEVNELISSQDSKEISILSIAGGSSRSIINMIKNIDTKKAEKISVVTVDKDESALKIGKEIADSLNFGHKFNWIHGNAKEIGNIFPNKKFDIVEIVGLLDYFEFDRAVNLLNHCYKLMNENGSIIIANVIPNIERRFVKNTGWPSMFYRHPDEVKNILISSNFKVVNDIIEPMCTHCVCVGKK